MPVELVRHAGQAGLSRSKTSISGCGSGRNEKIRPVAIDSLSNQQGEITDILKQMEGTSAEGLIGCPNVA